ncbi:hypothetical protein [Microbulbifer discodermiae]|uniref:hypothetical protein n=1 Tax=Microbulbifer sp. 2201CG32-9 TaxID=3232309 RepID=UPI00345B6CA9
MPSSFKCSKTLRRFCCSSCLLLFASIHSSTVIGSPFDSLESQCRELFYEYKSNYIPDPRLLEAYEIIDVRFSHTGLVPVASATCYAWHWDFREVAPGVLHYIEGKAGIILGWANWFGDAPPPDQHPTKCTIGNPVVISSGVKRQEEKLSSVPEQPLLDTAVIYSSGSQLWQTSFDYELTTSAVWKNNEWSVPAIWRTGVPRSLDWYLTPDISTAEELAIHVKTPRGSELVFHYLNNEWVEAHSKNAALQPLVDVNNNLTGWELQTPKEKQVYNTDGQLVKLQRRGSVKTTEIDLDYQSQRTIISSDTGQIVELIYDRENKLIEVIDPDGRSFSFEYFTDNLLERIIYPDETPAIDTDNAKKMFLYEDAREGHYGLLTGILDEAGVRFATWSYDEQMRAISSEHHGNAENVTLDYTHIDDTTDPRVTTTNALNKQTTYHFTTINGVRKFTQVEGHQSTNCAAANKGYTYDANGFIASETDWEGNTTTYTRDNLGRELTRTEAAGTPEAKVITTEWHPTLNLPTKITTAESVTDYSYDSAGRQLSKQVTPVATP